MVVPLPWECTVRGVPASLQASKTKIVDWRRRVAEAASARWPYGEPPLAQPLALLVAFMHLGQGLDVDNMLKPTLDGLIDVAYVDDALFEQVTGARWDLARSLRVERLTPVPAKAVVEAIVDERPFVYLRLSPPVELEELLR